MIDPLMRGFVRSVLGLRYRIRTTGLKEVAQKGRSGILFLANHPALMDPIVIMSVLHKEFRPRALADENQIDRFFIRSLARRVGAIPTPDLVASGPGARENVRKSLEKCIDVLASGQNLLLYPSGHAYHSRYEDLRGNSAVRTILDALPQQRVILIRQRGLWGSRFSRAWGVEPDVPAVVRRAAWVLPANGLFFMPRRKIEIELVEPDDLPRDASRKQLNAYLEEFFNRDAPPAKAVADFFWQRPREWILPEPEKPALRGDIENVSPATRQIVLDHLREVTGVEKIDWDDKLAADLGLDSLARADLLVWLQSEFGFSGGDVDAIVRVSDLALAASGTVPAGQSVTVQPPPGRWGPSGESRRLQTPPGQTLNEVLLEAARQDPKSPLLADQRSGLKTPRDLLTGVFALRPLLRDLPTEALGIMLPASVAAATLYTATLFSGKTPVLVNWTTAPGHVKHCLDLAGADRVLTARALLERLKGEGTDLSAIEDRLVCVEDLASGLSKTDKLRAALAARFKPSALLEIEPSPTAAVLFTSGSEALPKAVPLTHENILSNLRDLAEVFHLYSHDRMLGMLPPFHAFGLTVNICVPLCLHLPVVYHPDPTQSAVLARIIETWKTTLLVGTPTFLGGIVRSAPGPMPSLRLAVTGAEKAPPRLYEQLEQMCPSAKILEGYGVTECSPIVAVNDENDPRPQTIGKLLPGFEARLVDPESRQPGQDKNQGMLLLRGPSVFEGYLGPDAPDPFVQLEGQRWYNTGDLVARDEQGVYTFRGRWKRFVKIGGEMISLPAIESVLADAFEPEDADAPGLAVVPSGAEGQIQLVLFTTRDVGREQANRALREAGLSGLHNIREVRDIQEMPLLGTGKVNYRSLAEKLDSSQGSSEAE
jgi:long-chain-fatty-acid--[acyl-carrier-protein] ligase